MTSAARSAPSGPPADAPPDNWVDRHAPQAARPWLRLMRADRPIGTWLLLIPCWQGLALGAASGAGEAPRALAYAALFAAGAFVMRGAGCAYNDIVDRDFDAMVSRTARRPIPSGQVSVRGAWIFLVALALLGLAILLQFNAFTIALGLASLALVAVYPFAKRVTWWPQAWLGLTFNWGALMGFAALAGALSPAAIALYLAGLFWTLGYDTIYAHQDKEDDALIGVKSSARRLGRHTRAAVAGFYAATLVCFTLSGALAGLSEWYYLGLAPAAAHFFRQIRRLDIDDPMRCLDIFRGNREAGLLLLAPLLLAALLASR